MSNLIRCAACGDKHITSNHKCIESDYLLHYNNWLMLDKLDTIGHQLGYRVANVGKFMSYFQDYAKSISNPSKQRSQLHRQVCSALDVDYKDFKPFESDLIIGRPNYSLCLCILFSEVTNFLWTHTTIYQTKGYSYPKMIEIRERYLGTSDKYPAIYVEESDTFNSDMLVKK